MNGIMRIVVMTMTKAEILRIVEFQFEAFIVRLLDLIVEELMRELKITYYISMQSVCVCVCVCAEIR